MTHEERAQRRRQILKLLQDGVDQEQIAGRFNVGITYVRSMASLAGLRSPRAAGDLALRILASILRGQPFLKIAAEYGVSKQYVYSLKDRARAAGIPIPAPGDTQPVNLRGPGRPSRAAPTARAIANKPGANHA